MDFFDFLRFIGGISLFLYGMNVMGGSLEKLAGGSMKAVVKRITASRIRGVLLGTIVTAVIQSSSATMVMVVGLVNSGIMSVGNSIGIIMGSNIGTTATGWLLSLTGIDGTGSFLLRLCKPSSFSPVLAAIGVCLCIFDKKSDRRKDIGSILLGFAVLMFGMETMTDAMSEINLDILTVLRNPIVGVLAGILVTALLQSVSASVGVLQAMAVAGAVQYDIAIPLIMGMSIGASTPVLISSIGANSDAKRASFLYLLFNVFGTVICMVVFYGLDMIFDFPLMDQNASVIGIALANTIFKVVSTVILLPFSKHLMALSRICIKGKAVEQKHQVLDERFLPNPAYAVTRCQELTFEMAALSRNALFGAMDLINKYSDAAAREIVETEDQVDRYEDMLDSFMVKLSAHSMHMNESREISKLLHCIGDFERISDHALNIKESAEEMHEKKLHFSSAAASELQVLHSAVREIVETAMDAFLKNDIEIAKRVEPLEQVVDDLVERMKTRHVHRLQEGSCTMLLGFVFSDLVTNFERVADHCSNIAVCLIETKNDSFETHEYLNRLTLSNDREYAALLTDYAKKYSIE